MMNKTFLFTACFLLTIAAHSQTKLIALKSHSGSAAHYRTERFGNFGIIRMPEARLEKVEKLNDSTVVLTNRVTDEYVRDTIMYHPQFSAPGATEERLRKLYNNEVEFENFDPQPPPTIESEEGPSNEPVERPGEKPNRMPQEKRTPVPANGSTDPDNRRNSILLLIIGGGTFLGTGLIAAVRRRKKALATYA